MFPKTLHRRLDDAVTHVVALNNALALRSENDTVGAYKRYSKWA
jgi:hypothetical protein